MLTNLPPRSRAKIYVVQRISETERRKRSAEGRYFGCGRQGHLKRDCPNRVKGKKKEENVRVATMELQEEKEGQEYAEKEKRSDAPDPPPYLRPCRLH